MEKMTLPLSSLIVDPNFNSRTSLDISEDNPNKTAQTIEELSRDMKDKGQLTPILVTPEPGGKFSLVAGFRRVAAAKLNNAVTIEAQIWNGTKVEAKIVNLVENIARKDLRPYEIGKAIFKLHTEDKLSGPKIAEKTHIGTAHVNNLIRAFKNLHAKILEAWSKGNGICTTMNLFKWASLDKAEQIEEFSKACGVETDGKGEIQEDKDKGSKGTGKGDKEAKPKSRKFDVLSAALAAVKKSKEDAKWKNGAVQALEFAMGIRETIGDAYDMEEEEAKQEAAKQKDKEAKAAEKAAKLAEEKAKEAEELKKLAKDPKAAAEAFKRKPKKDKEEGEGEGEDGEEEE